MPRSVTERAALRIASGLLAFLVAFEIDPSVVSASTPVSGSAPSASPTIAEATAPDLSQTDRDDGAAQGASILEPAQNHASDPASEAGTKQQKRNTIILSMLVAGIALTGLLLVIVAIVVRGFLRKMARQSATQRQAELVLPPDVASAAAAATADDNVDESIPFSERETEVT